MKRFTTTIFVLAVATLAFGCGSQTAEDVAEEPSASEEVSPTAARDDAVKAAITEDIQAQGETVAFPIPGADGDVDLTFDYVHGTVHETAGGRYSACVDFKAEDGTVYDVDYYVGGSEGSFAVAEAVVHKVSGESVLSDEEMTRLGEAE